MHYCTSPAPHWCSCSTLKTKQHAWHAIYPTFHLTINLPCSGFSVSFCWCLSAVNIYAGAFLIPVGVMLYTAHGGLKATYMAAWGHGECWLEIELLCPMSPAAWLFSIQETRAQFYPRQCDHAVSENPAQCNSSPLSTLCTALPFCPVAVIYLALVIFSFLIYVSTNMIQHLDRASRGQTAGILLVCYSSPPQTQFCMSHSSPVTIVALQPVFSLCRLPPTATWAWDPLRLCTTS